MNPASDSSRPDGRRLRSAASRVEILDAAERALAEGGYAETSIRRVSVAAGMSAPGVARHFATKQALFVALLERIQDRNLAALTGSELGRLDAAERIVLQAEQLASRRRETELYTVMLGEARTPEHLGHDWIIGQMNGVHARLIGEFGSVGPALHAAWDGLRLLGLYLPGRVDAAQSLAYRLRTGATTETPAAPRGEPAAASDAPRGDDDAVEARILRSAIRVFAGSGYRDARIREIAADAGIAHSTLLYHYPTKQALLQGVFDSDGTELATRIPRGIARDGGEFLRLVHEVALSTTRENEAEIERVRSALAFEAIEPQHPANGYFVTRFGGQLDRLMGVFRDVEAAGELAPGVEPVAEATWTLALWEGLRIQTFYLPMEGAAELIRTEINRALVPSRHLT